MIEIDQALRRELSRFGFDEAQLARFAARAAASEPTAIAGTIEPLAPEDTTALPPPGTAEYDLFAKRGRQALAKHEVGVVILAGGMATRFGGAVKAAVPVIADKSFLAVKVADVHRHGDVPIYVMTSSATHDRVVEQVKTERLEGVECFPQHVSLRLTPAGELFKDGSGAASPYATGHGDLTFALRASGVLAQFRRGGGALLYVSNVDNVAAMLDPAVIGAHLTSAAKVTTEVVRKEPGDRGGAPARVDGRPEIVEAFRFPKGFDQNRLVLFNTNSFVFDAEAIDRDFDLTFFRVEKAVDKTKVIQFERLVGELTALLPSHFLVVPRSRFLPVKDPEELELRRADIAALLRAYGITQAH